jgi:hypothetical protein
LKCFLSLQPYAAFFPAPTIIQPWPPTATCYDLSTIFSINGLAACAAFKPIHTAGNAGSVVPQNARPYGGSNGNSSGSSRSHHNSRGNSNKMMNHHSQHNVQGGQPQYPNSGNNRQSHSNSVQGPLVSSASNVGSVNESGGPVSANSAGNPNIKPYHQSSQSQHSSNHSSNPTLHGGRGGPSLLSNAMYASSTVAQNGQTQSPATMSANNTRTPNYQSSGAPNGGQRAYHSYNQHSNSEFNRRAKPHNQTDPSLQRQVESTGSYSKNALSINGYVVASSVASQSNASANTSAVPTAYLSSNPQKFTKNRNKKKREEASSGSDRPNNLSINSSGDSCEFANVAPTTASALPIVAVPAAATPVGPLPNGLHHPTNHSHYPQANHPHKYAQKKHFADDKKQFDFQSTAFPPLPGSAPANARHVPKQDNEAFVSDSDGTCLAADVVKGNHRNSNGSFPPSFKPNKPANVEKELSHGKGLEQVESQIKSLSLHTPNDQKANGSSTAPNAIASHNPKLKPTSSIATNFSPSSYSSPPSSAAKISVVKDEPLIDAPVSQSVASFVEVSSLISNSDEVVAALSVDSKRTSLGSSVSEHFPDDESINEDVSNSSMNGHEIKNKLDVHSPKKLLSYSEVAKSNKTGATVPPANSADSSSPAPDVKEDKKDALASSGNANGATQPATSTSTPHQNSKLFNSCHI